MTNLSRVRVRLTGFRGGPGVATHYFLDTATAVASLKTFWSLMAAGMPDDVKIVVSEAGDIIDDVSGDLVGAWDNATAEVTISGLGLVAAAAPAGAVINWLTSTILDGSRVRGKTFIVPLSVTAYETDGSITDGTISGLTTAANALIAEQSASFVVWHRPKFGPKSTLSGLRPKIRDGGHGLVVNSRIPDLVAVLRSRRD
jgi:hypothetical protein